MVGVPRSSRCLQCKKRKIKCDEAWPTCGQCKHSKKQCFGPTSHTRFVHSDYKNSPLPAQKPDEVATIPSSQSPPCQWTMIDVSLHPAEIGGGIFCEMRLSRDLPKTVPSTPDEQLAIKFASMLISGRGSGYDLYMTAQSMGHLPQRMVRSPALRDASSCLMTAWFNLRLGLPLEQVLDTRVYGKALRSLQQALNDPKERFSTNTLATTVLLQKVESFFDVNRGANRAAHNVGVHSLMKARGPPKVDDEFEMLLAMESQGILLSYCLMQGKDWFFLNPEWTRAFDEAIDSGTIQSEFYKYFFSLFQLMMEWPQLVHILRSVHDEPNVSDRAIRLEEITSRATETLGRLEEMEGSLIDGFWDCEDIVEVATENPPFFSAYKFASIHIAMCYSYHAMTSLILKQILAQADALAGGFDPTVEPRNKLWSRRIWLSYYYCREYKPWASSFFIAALVFSYESGNEVERAFIREALNDMEAHRRPAPDRWIDRTIMANCRAATGRLSYIKTQDVNVELRGEGARS